MPTTTSAPRDHRRRRRAAALATGALALAGALVTSTTPAGAQTDPFGTAQAGAQSAPGASPGVLVAGDSLTVQAGWFTSTGLAAPIAQVTGRSTAVSAAAGASYRTYYDANQTAGNWTLSAYAYLFRPAVTVTALGSNDARIMNSHPTIYDRVTFRNLAIAGLKDQMQWSKCALLINTYTGSGDPNFPASTTTTVNTELFNASLEVNISLRAQRVFIADWNKVAKANHSRYYPGNDIHLTVLGTGAYRDFIVAETKALLAKPQCR